MPRDGSKTRSHILDVTRDLVMEHGMAGTSLDQVITRAGLTKGAFFYHFKGKDELAFELVKRFAQQDEALLRDVMQKAEGLSRDPLQQVLLMVGLVAEMFRGLGGANPGCLFASFCYEGDLWGEEFRRLCAANFRLWRDSIAAKLRQAAKATPPRISVDIDTVADMATGVIEGAYIMARTYADTSVIVGQLMQYRNYLELLFAPQDKPAKSPRRRATPRR